MKEGLESLFGVFQDFLTGLADFWNWFITPVLQFGDLKIAPIAIFGFTTFIVVFTMILIHLFNPLS